LETTLMSAQHAVLATLSESLILAQD